MRRCAVAFVGLLVIALLQLGCKPESSRIRQPAISFCFSPSSEWHSDVDVTVIGDGHGHEEQIGSALRQVGREQCTFPYTFAMARVGSYASFRVRVTGPMVPFHARFFSQTGQVGEVPMTRDMSVSGNLYNYWAIHVHVPPTELSGVASVTLYPGDPGQL